MHTYVLVVDDDDDLREAVADVLDSAGYKVLTAEHGVAALSQMRAAKPCLVLLDLMMPVMDGWQVLQEMSGDPDLTQIPVCVVSAQSHAAPPTATTILKKPVSVADLVGAVAEYCTAP